MRYGWQRRCLALLLCLALSGCAAARTSPTASPPAPLVTPSKAATLPTTIATPAIASLAAPAAANPASPVSGPARDTLIALGALTIPRAAHTATLLPNGKVLLVGGCTLASCDMDANGATAELYDPATNTFDRTGSLAVQRVSHTATALPDGRVLIAGGWRKGALNDSVEIYDQARGTFAPVGRLATARGGHAAALLADGRVLLTGGSGASGALASAELFDPANGSATPLGEMTTPRSGPVAVTLADGRVLIAGGDAGRDRVLASAEIFDPRSGTFARAGAMASVRHKHAAIRLRDGRVLVVGGSDNRDFQGRYASAELFDPATGSFTPAGEMARRRFKLSDTLALLPNGEVLIAGGGERPEIYSPSTATFRAIDGSFGTAWSFATATALLDGRVLIVGGYDDGITPTARMWLYVPSP